MSRLLYVIGVAAARHPWRIVAGWIAAAVIVTGLAGTVGGTLQDTFTIPGSQTQQTTDLLKDRFPAMSGTSARVVAHTEVGSLDAATLERAATRLRELSAVTTVSPPVTDRQGTTAVIAVQYDVPVTHFAGATGLDDLERAAQPLHDAGYQVEFGGPVPEAVQEPTGRAEIIGVLAALVILCLALAALVAASLPVAVALVGLVVGTAGITLLAAVTDVSTNSPALASMVGLGIGIDYALFILARHRDGLAEGQPMIESIGRANATAGQAVVFAGGTVLLALAGLQFSGVPDFATMGYATGVVVLATVLAAVTLLPALLGILKMRAYGRKARRAPRLESTMSHSPAAARFARVVGRRPVLWLVVALTLLVTLAAPALGMRVGQSDAGNEAPTTTVRRAYDLIETGFGPGANGPLVVGVDLHKAGGATALDPLARDIAATPNVAAVSRPVISPDGSAAVITVTPQTGPQDAATTDLLKRLRADVLPDGAGIASWTAAMVDLSDVLVQRLWLVIAVVIGTSVLLLVLAFRSIFVPVKAALVNLLSTGAAYGAITLAFQTETGARLLGLPGEVPIAAYVPLLIFAVLFGLSMDYEVFLLSRIREEYRRTADSRTSVITGLASTARVITSAALIMIAVFLGFALDPNVVIKMIGVGMAAAIAVDATLIRLIVVPATMALLGRRAWYLPRWLDRILPGPSHRPHSSAALAPPPAQPRSEAPQPQLVN